MSQLSLFEQTPAQPVPPAGLTLCPELKVTCTRSCVVNESATRAGTPAEMAAFARDIVESAPWYDPCKECVVVFFVNSAGRVFGHNLVSLGSLTASLVSPREVFRAALGAAARSIVLCHTHPSGSVEPSSPDLQVTRLLRDASKFLDIEFIDHLILGSPSMDPSRQGFYSFRAAGIV